MSKLVVLNLGAGNLDNGFPNIIAQLRLKDGKIEQFIGSLPPAPELATLNQQWQTLYYALHQRFDVARRRLFEVEEQGITNISTATFQELCQEIENKFNSWLDSPSFLKIDRKLRTKLDSNEEIQIIIETGDYTLHRFPWHLWHFLEDYQQAEIGLSNLEYSPIKLEKKQRNKPRILTILGHSEGINIKADQALIAQINNAEIVFLVEPKSAEFHEKLWDEKGWDILFFAGHSHTENHQGIIFINPQESLNIKELKTAINKAIKQGLQLAIFNSCDGIGLAEELSKLNLPQIIVMREGVPDLIAQEFLKYFLSALQQNKSVFCSLREARERLQAWDKDFPGGSWLPMICQNPSTIIKSENQVNSGFIINNLYESIREKLEINFLGRFKKSKEINDKVDKNDNNKDKLIDTSEDKQEIDSNNETDNELKTKSQENPNKQNKPNNTNLNVKIATLLIISIATIFAVQIGKARQEFFLYYYLLAEQTKNYLLNTKTVANFFTIETVNDILNQKPDSSIYDKLAVINAEKGEHKKAWDWYSKAIESNPKNINAYIGRGYVNIELKNYDLANQDLDKAIQINPNSSNVYHIKGLLEDDKNNLLDAVSYAVPLASHSMIKP
ncbi:CHAT domain-containing protein [Cyanobacterium aponinum UTEX 3222]|uniref:CHAT domain-containing tetratricopeptide repeat protein n=1 Tax=Cyanobacterium aponinum TaxID=379064 RepID=UPI0030926F3E|nr:CHAT domain-containing protein [Cyanobacterium aponinum UTEX 3222]